MTNLMIFEGKNVNMIIGENGEPLFELYSVGQALGYERANAAGKLYPRKSHIDGIVKNNNISVVTDGCHNYLKESQLYKFIMKSNTKAADPFMDWVTEEVLPSIRKNGAYVSETITDKQQELLVKYGAPRFRKNTFSTTPVEQLEVAYRECMEYHKKKSAPERIRIEKEIISTLEERERQALINGSAPLALLIKTEITKIQKKITERSNRSYGTRLAQTNKKLNAANVQLEEAYNFIDRIMPAAEEYYCLNLHGFSVNAQYIPDTNEFGMVRTDWNGKPKFRRSDAYNKWLDDFKTEMDKLGDLNFDFENGVDIYLYFDHMQKFDCHNFHKSVFDALSKHFNVDDKYFHLKGCDTNYFVNDYSQGRIYFCIREREAM